LSASQLPAIVIVFLTWEFWQTDSRKGLHFSICGALLGFGLHFRPETVFILLIGIGKIVLQPKKRNAQSDLIHSLLYLVGPLSVIYFFTLKLRYLLGGVDSADHTFYTVGYDIFANGWNTLSLEVTSPLTDIFKSPLFSKL